MNEQMKSSVVDQNVEQVEISQFMAPTAGLLSVLVLAFIIFKFFIYIKDEKRDGL